MSKWSDRIVRLHFACTQVKYKIFQLKLKTSAKTTTDICKFPPNYTLLPSHNGTYFHLASTSPIQANTCAEVTAFTPTTTHPPHFKAALSHQHNHIVSHTSVYLALPLLCCSHNRLNVCVILFRLVLSASLCVACCFGSYSSTCKEKNGATVLSIALGNCCMCICATIAIV